MGFFDRVKDLTKKNTTLTLRAFIESLGFNYETYYSGKRRENLPRADEAVRIAKTLGVSVEYLVTGNDGLSEGERELIRAYNLLNETGKEAALATVKGLVITYPIPAVIGTAGNVG